MKVSDHSFFSKNFAAFSLPTCIKKTFRINRAFKLRCHPTHDYRPVLRQALTGSGWRGNGYYCCAAGDKSSVAAGAADGERGVMDSLVDDKAKARAPWGEGMLAAVRGGWQGAKVCARST